MASSFVLFLSVGDDVILPGSVCLFCVSGVHTVESELQKLLKNKVDLLISNLTRPGINNDSIRNASLSRKHKLIKLKMSVVQRSVVSRSFS